MWQWWAWLDSCSGLLSGSVSNSVTESSVTTYTITHGYIQSFNWFTILQRVLQLTSRVPEDLVYLSNY